jgi:hypothetical protein
MLTNRIIFLNMLDVGKADVNIRCHFFIQNVWLAQVEKHFVWNTYLILKAE